MKEAFKKIVCFNKNCKSFAKQYLTNCEKYSSRTIHLCEEFKTKDSVKKQESI